MLIFNIELDKNYINLIFDFLSVSVYHENISRVMNINCVKERVSVKNWEVNKNFY